MLNNNRETEQKLSQRLSPATSDPQSSRVSLSDLAVPPANNVSDSLEAHTSSSKCEPSQRKLSLCRIQDLAVIYRENCSSIPISVWSSLVTNIVSKPFLSVIESLVDSHRGQALLTWGVTFLLFWSTFSATELALKRVFHRESSEEQNSRKARTVLFTLPADILFSIVFTLLDNHLLEQGFPVKQAQSYAQIATNLPWLAILPAWKYYCFNIFQPKEGMERPMGLIKVLARDLFNTFRR